MIEYIRCQKCSWRGTWEECEERPGKFIGELHKWCPKCRRCRTFLKANPPLNYPQLTTEDMLSLPALSIRQPWAWLVAEGHKGYENRDWDVKNPGRRFRGRFLIHASSGCTKLEYLQACRVARACHRRATGQDLVIPDLEDLARGCIVGTATVTDWSDGAPYDQPWAFGSGLIITDPKPCAPVVLKGMLGFFKPYFHLPKEGATK